MKKDDDNHNVTVRAAETFPTTISHHFNIQKMSSILCLFPSFFLFLFACIFIGNLISLFRSLFTSMPHLTASRVEQASLARCLCKLLFFLRCSSTVRVAGDVEEEKRANLSNTNLYAFHGKKKLIFTNLNRK